jgi:Cys-rich protein (TIGR01571 family)
MGGYGGCLSMFLAGQISTRLGWFDTLTVVVSYFVMVAFFWLIGFIIVAAVPYDAAAASILLFWFPYMAAFVFLMLLRVKFVERFQIPEDPVETFCIGFWCSPCSLCQMARHLYGYTRQFDGDGLLDGSMNYQLVPSNIGTGDSYRNINFSPSSNPLYVPPESGPGSQQYPGSLQSASALPQPGGRTASSNPPAPTYTSATYNYNNYGGGNSGATISNYPPAASV